MTIVLCIECIGLKRKMSSVLNGRLASAAVELAAATSSTAAVVESMTIGFCTECIGLERKAESCIEWLTGQRFGRAGRRHKLDRSGDRADQ